MMRFHRYTLSALMCAVFVMSLFYSEERNRGELQIYFLDVGQGDAMYLRSPNGRDMLVDGGPSQIVLRRLSKVMPWYDRSIDVVMETHPDADHIGGLPLVLDRYRIGVMLEPGVESDNAIDDELRSLRKKHGIDSIIARRGMRVNFGDGTHFDILYPDADVSNYETNTASIVGRAVYGSTSVMLMADSPKSIEKYLISLDGPRLKSDILKAGHHGSHTSSDQRFVGIVSPTYSILSLGADNRYGHPHNEVVEVFDSLGVQMLRTDESGTIGFVSDGRSFIRK